MRKIWRKKAVLKKMLNRMIMERKVGKNHRKKRERGGELMLRIGINLKRQRK